jgi:hypothetical protein
MEILIQEMTTSKTTIFRHGPSLEKNWNQNNLKIQESTQFYGPRKECATQVTRHV